MFSPLGPKQSILSASVCIAMLAAAFALALPAQAQTFSVIHTFSGGDGGNPVAGLTIDARGRLYGTTQTGGRQNGFCPQEGCGVIFRLAPQGSGWILTPLHQFGPQRRRRDSDVQTGLRTQWPAVRHNRCRG